jgi:hypothetical protein
MRVLGTQAGAVGRFPNTTQDEVYCLGTMIGMLGHQRWVGVAGRFLHNLFQDLKNSKKF